MIVIDKDFKKLKYLVSEKSPNVVVYNSIFNDNIIKKTNSIIEDLFKNTTSDSLWITENSQWNYKRFSSHMFPEFLNKLKVFIMKVTNKRVNCCIIRKYDKSSKYILDRPTFNEDEIVSTVIVGNDTDYCLKLESIDNNTDICIKNGSILIEMDKFIEECDIKNESENEFFTISFFYYKYDRKILEFQKKRLRKLKNKKSIYNLKLMYLTSKTRNILRNFMKNKIRLSYDGNKSCILKDGANYMKDNIMLEKRIGEGDWGNVYMTSLKNKIINKNKFAIKVSRITQDDYDNPFTDSSYSWYEIWILKDIIKPIIVNSICPNLPLYIDTFLCDKCDFIFKNNKKQFPCISIATELGRGDLKYFFLNYFPVEKVLFSILFQILAGLHAIQMSGQILHNDIKVKNILYYKVRPGGYWKYIVNNKNFYIPNYGYIFILNDFGVSTMYSPCFKLYPNKKTRVYNLGSRYAINMDGVFSPINTYYSYTSNKKYRKSNTISWVDNDSKILKSKGGKFKSVRDTDKIVLLKTKLTKEQQNYLFDNKITVNPSTKSFFGNPYILPPFEFYNDVQDVIRMFIGGKRTTQRGDHKKYDVIPDSFVNKLKKYEGKGTNSKSNIFSVNSYEVLAGDLITKIFNENSDYTIKKPNIKILDTYDMSNIYEYF